MPVIEFREEGEKDMTVENVTLKENGWVQVYKTDATVNTYQLIPKDRVKRIITEESEAKGNNESGVELI